ncbi:hypothetical protein, partial [Escherichia coli]|uniref:hypothetical protein n=1 Tax=Escherichia coli TaxID=562 RepID=UPI001F3D6AD7
LRQKQKKLIMLPSEIMIWQPEFTDKILSRKPGAVQASDDTYRIAGVSGQSTNPFVAKAVAKRNAAR